MAYKAIIVIFFEILVIKSVARVQTIVYYALVINERHFINARVGAFIE